MTVNILIYVKILIAHPAFPRCGMHLFGIHCILLKTIVCFRCDEVEKDDEVKVIRHTRIYNL